MIGTFYLLVLGIAAFAGGAVSYAGASFSVQAVVASAVGVVGSILVNNYRKQSIRTSGNANALDVGQSVTIESWLNAHEGLARVKYRGALWDAVVEGERGAEQDQIFYICRTDGNTLHISRTKPA